MIAGDIHTVAIIGAGISGLATAKTLLAQGYDCTVFERADRLGGVWADGYVDFGVQVQKELYQFPDWPLPDDTPNFTPGDVFQRYLESYAEHFGITPHIRTGSAVTALAPRNSGRAGWRLDVLQGGETTRLQYDLVVVATGLYSQKPHIPEFPGRDSYGGRCLHVSDLKTLTPLEDRKVAVIGYGKSATDAALMAAGCARDTHLVFRDVHWPVPRNLAGLVPFKWGMLSRMTASLVTPYLHPNPVARWLNGVGRPLPWIFWRIVEWLLIVQWGLHTRIAGGRNLIPSKPVEIDAFGESTMVPRPDLYRAIRQGRIIAHRSEIAEFTPSGLSLADGTQLDTDCVVFATGWQNDQTIFPARARASLDVGDDGFYLYRHMLHPDVDNLVFIGRVSSFSSVLTYCLQARWLAELLAGRVRLPDRAEMLDEIAGMKAWKRAWMPFSASRGARLLLHMMHYHDELLVDFGADPLRKRGLLAPLKELLLPYQPSDYRAIVAGPDRQNW